MNKEYTINFLCLDLNIKKYDVTVGVHPQVSKPLSLYASEYNFDLADKKVQDKIVNNIMFENKPEYGIKTVFTQEGDKFKKGLIVSDVMSYLRFNNPEFTVANSNLFPYVDIKNIDDAYNVMSAIHEEIMKMSDGDTTLAGKMFFISQFSGVNLFPSDSIVEIIRTSNIEQILKFVVFVEKCNRIEVPLTDLKESFNIAQTFKYDEWDIF